MGVKIQIAGEFNPRAFMQASSQLDALRRQAALNAGGMAGGFARAGQSLQAIGGKISSVGATMTKTVTLPILGIAAAGVAAFNTVSNAEADLTRRTGATGDELEKLKVTFRETASKSSSEMSMISPVLAQIYDRLGLTGSAASDVTLRMIRLAKVTGDDATVAAQEVTKAMKDWSVTAARAPAFFDKLAVAAQKSGVSVTTLATNLYTFGSPLRTLGFGLDQTIALLANFERSGVRTELVMGSLRIGLGNLAKAGAKDLPAAMAKSIKAIKDAKSPTEATGLAFKLFGKRAGADMAAAIREGRFSVDDLMRALSSSSGALDRTTADASTLGKAWGIAKNNLLLAASTVGDTLAPYLSKLAGWVTTTAQAFSKLSPEAKRFGVVFAIMTAAIGPVLSVVGSLASSLGGLMLVMGGAGGGGILAGLTGGLGSLGSAAGAAAGATGGLGGILGGLGAAAGPALVVVAAIAGVGYLLYKNWGQIQPMLVRLGAAFAPAARQMQTAVTAAIGPIRQTISRLSAEVVPTMRAVVGYIIAAWTALRPVVMPILLGIVGFVGGALNAILNVVRVVMAVIRGDWSGAWEALKAAGVAIWGGIVSLIGGLAQGLGVVLSAVWSGILTTSTATWNGIKAFLGSIWEGIKQSIATALALIIGIVTGNWGAVGNITNSLLAPLAGIVSRAWSAIKGAISAAWPAIKSSVSSGWSTVVSFFKGIDLVAIGKAVMEGFKRGLESIFSSIRTSVSAFVSDITSRIKKLLGVRSPSTVYAGIGRNLGLGLMLGLEQSRVGVAAAAARLANSTIIRPGIPMLAGAGGSAFASAGSGRSVTIAPGAVVVRIDGAAAADPGLEARIKAGVNAALSELVAEIQKAGR